LWRYILSELLVEARFDDPGFDDPEGSDAELSPLDAPIVRQAIHILVVDDDASIRTTLCAFLEDEGYSVDAATNGVEALRSMARQRPTLVLLDMRMPIMDGWGFARELRARNITVPIVVMTAAWDAQRWAEEIGATAYVSKPFDLSELLAMLDNLCS
jgi:CheY-like chemotaxis protein